MPFSRRTANMALLTFAAWGLSVSAHAQQATPSPAWPTKPLRIIVGFPGGSSPDLTARAFAEPLSKALGQPVIVDNKVGAAGNIAADAVATITRAVTDALTQAGLREPTIFTVTPSQGARRDA